MDKAVKSFPSFSSWPRGNHNSIFASIVVHFVDFNPVASLVVQFLHPKSIVITTMLFEELVGKGGVKYEVGEIGEPR